MPEPAENPAVPGTDAGVTANAVTTSDAMPLGGAPSNNANRLCHGLRGRPEVNAIRLALGTLPPSLARVERGVFAFRRLLEDATADTHGKIDLMHALAIQTACKHERHSALCLRWLREHEAKMTHEQRIKYSAEIAKASAERDRAIERLGLGERTPQNEWAAFDALPAIAFATPTAPAMPTIEATADAPAGHVGGVEGNGDDNRGDWTGKEST
ncbi:MAG TPA: hypothetical protein VMV69_08760 [Pirellulales bacterium]|nr:hypothetical protein [Pirellulales bacterium]